MLLAKVTWELLYLRMRHLRWHGDWKRFSESLEHKMLKYGHKYQFFGGLHDFRFASFAKNLKGENDE